MQLLWEKISIQMKIKNSVKIEHENLVHKKLKIDKTVVKFFISWYFFTKLILVNFSAFHSFKQNVYPET